MSQLSIEEHELLCFFEGEPKRLDPETPWPYDDLLYEVARGDLTLSFAVMPAHGDVRIVLKRNGATLYELDAVGVEDARYRDENGHESLEVFIDKRNTVRLWLKPSIRIGHLAHEAG